MRRITGVLIVLVAALIVPTPAQAAFPGANGKIAFVSNHEAPSGCTTCWDVYTMNPDTSNVTRLTNEPTIERELEWSPDGNKILFTRPRTNPDGTDIWVMNADGSGQQNLTNGAYPDLQSASWSPDQAKIVFGATIAPDFDPFLWIINADGSGAPEKIPNSFPDGFGPHSAISWSPDGNSILWTGTAISIKAIDVDGTNLRFLNNSFSPGTANWAPDMTKVVFVQWSGNAEGLWLAEPDGTNQQPISSADDIRYRGNPVWSPDGTKILYAYQGEPETGYKSELWTVDPDGSDPAQLTNSPTVQFASADWQPLPGPGPNADVLASITDSPDPVKGGADLTYTATIKNLVGPSAATGATLTVNLPSQATYVSATPTQGSCSHAAAVVTCNMGTIPVGGEASVTISVEPPNVIAPTNLSATATATASQPDPVTGNNSATAQTQVIFGGYARPRSATQALISLVPAYKTCTPEEATLQHAAPLNHMSCASPVQTSAYLTAGTPDANAQPSNFVGSIKYKALNEPLPLNPNNGDQSDIGLEVSIVGVRKKTDLTPYAGSLTADTALRVTDHASGAGGFSSNTGTPPNLTFNIPCSAGTCSLASTYEAVVPGAVKELQRAVWEFGGVRVIDGGADGNPATSPNTLFATQGIFVP